jgi:pimeloyl-ACP methyl ester carboxylesterase
MNTSIPFFDFGGQGPQLHFAHANGYPPECYKRMLTPLLEDYRVTAVYHRPLWHDGRPQELKSWRELADDLLLLFDSQGIADVIGVGHSLGAVVTMYAALQRPELFRALILIEPVFLMPAMLQQVALRGAPLGAEDFDLVRIANSRRNSWSSRQEAFDHFRPKRVFARLSDDALWDYVYYGLRKEDNGDITLTYSAEWEAMIYALPPTDVWDLLPQVTHPTLALRGGETDTLVPAAWQLWRMSQPQAAFVEMPQVGHLLPMEEPDKTAAAIQAFLNKL